MPKCISCKQDKPAEEFYGNKKKSSRCTTCQSTYLKKYRNQARMDALYAYGGENPTCSCPGCTENRLPFLCIDHINGGGNKQRQELTQNQKSTRDGKMNPGGGVFYRWLRTNSYPAGYRVLCHNCNTARSNGPCPVHETSDNVSTT